MYGLSSFFIGEQRVAAELGPMMRAAPDEDMRIFLCTQIADEARHVAFFDRFYTEVGVLEADDLEARLAETSEHLNPEFGVLFDEMLKRRVDRLARRARGPRDAGRGVTIYHMVIEGMLALTGQHFIIDYNEREGTLPGFVEGFTQRRPRRAPPRRVRRALPARHGAARPALQRGDPAHARPRSRPVADGVLRPQWVDARTTRTRCFGVVGDETRAFAMKALERRLKVIGLARRPAASQARGDAARLRALVRAAGAMSVVRPEFGPTLPELLAPRVRPRCPRGALVALARARGRSSSPARPRGRPRRGSERRAPARRRPRAGRLQLRLPRAARSGPPARGRDAPARRRRRAPRRRSRFAVDAAALPPYRGDATGILHARSRRTDRADAEGASRLRAGGARGA